MPRVVRSGWWNKRWPRSVERSRRILAGREPVVLRTEVPMPRRFSSGLSAATLGSSTRPPAARRLSATACSGFLSPKTLFTNTLHRNAKRIVVRANSRADSLVKDPLVAEQWLVPVLGLTRMGHAKEAGATRVWGADLEAGLCLCRKPRRPPRRYCAPVGATRGNRFADARSIRSAGNRICLQALSLSSLDRTSIAACSARALNGWLMVVSL